MQSDTATFITWDGPDQNYLESLFLPIFDGARSADLDFTVLQFTWGPDELRESIRRTAAGLQIPYEVHTVWRKPLKLATAAMIAAGAARIIAHARRHGTTVLMPRSIIPAAMTLIARRRLPDVRIVYDSDGFMADERVEFQGWSSQGITYRIFRDVEAQISRVADRVMTRSHSGADILRERVGPELDDICVVPNAKDADQFSPRSADRRREMRRISDIDDDAPFIIYAGSLGPRYKPEALFELFRRIHDRDDRSRLMVLTGNKEVARSMIDADDYPSRAVSVGRVAPDEVADYLASADLGISFREPSFSQRGVCPIKIAEYLLCGLPTVASTGVGDVADQIDDSVGIAVDDVDDATLDGIVDDFFERILPDRDGFRERCRQTGLDHFGLHRAARGYRRALGVD